MACPLPRMGLVSCRRERTLSNDGHAGFVLRRRKLPVLLAILGVLVVGGLAAALADDDPDGPGPRAAAGASARSCGAASAATLAAVQSTVARRIYADELYGTETRLDAARVRSYGPLRSALESGSRRRVAEAVHALVYKPHWHIVRLLVLRAGRVLADVGGPDVLAPVGGTLSAGGRYVMSVQDDLGYVKLVTRFIGAPIGLYRDGTFVMGTAQRATTSAAAAGGSDGYAVRPLALRAFPSGALQAALFVPDAQSAASCAALRLAAWGSIARHVAARLQPLPRHYRDLASVLHAVTGGRLLVREGSRRLVGAGARHLPTAGEIRYAGRRWAVYSWQPQAGQRAYFLTPPGS